MPTIFRDMLNILKAPIVGELDTIHLFILIGLVLILIIAWLHILGYIELGLKEVV